MLTKKTALITGAAGDIGANVVRRLNYLGYKLILLDSNQSSLNKLADECASATAVVFDLSDRVALKEFIAGIDENYGNIDLAFFNASIIKIGNIQDLHYDAIDLQLEINLRSTIHLIKACASNMAKNKSGHIISTVSMGGIVSLGGSATYSASKFGLRGFMNAMREELKPLGISVSGIYPSGVDTQMLRYEARNGGSALNFLSTPQAVDVVGKSVICAMKTKKLEYYVPYLDGLIGRFFSFFPWLVHFFYPMMLRLGEAGRKRYLKSINE